MSTRRISNELIVFTQELEWDAEFLAAVKSGGTNQISVDAARSFRTPFGTYMIIATLSVTGDNVSTWRLREYLSRRLSAAGLECGIDDVLAPAKPKSFRVE